MIGYVGITLLISNPSDICDTITGLSGRLGTTVGPAGRRFGGPPSPTGHDAPTRQGLGSDAPELPTRGLPTMRLPFAKFIFTTSCWLVKCKLDDVPPELARGVSAMGLA